MNFQAVRIGHGVRCTENPLVMQELADRETALELCPTSNLNTKIYETIEDYPIQQLMNKGIRVTVNTDNMMVSTLQRRGNLHWLQIHLIWRRKMLRS